jgi:predicted phage terminase large subunit-like protein
LPTALLADEDILAELTNARELEVHLDRVLLERSFYAYVRAAWHLLEPSPTPWLTETPETFVENWHIKTLCEQLERCFYGEEKRVIFNVPPGTMKSLLVMVLFPTWVWAKRRSARFLCASHGMTLATRDNLRARQIIESQWYQQRWPIKLDEDQNTKTRYNTEDHGWRIAVSVGGPGIGEHPDYILIDDPETDAQAQSDAERASVNDWYDRTLSVRLGRNPAIILIMQRLHEDDLSGHLIARGGWTHLHWPMRYEVSRPVGDDEPGYTACPLDPRTTERELLFPGLFPEDRVAQMERDLGEYGTAGQLQQQPAPRGGGLFKREWFVGKFLDVAPKLMRVVRGWDTAATEGDGCYTVGSKVGEEFDVRVENGRKQTVSTGRFIVLDVARAQLAPDGVDTLMLTTAQADGKDVAQREEREGGASGVSQIVARRKLLVGFDYDEVPLEANKVVRAKPFRSQCAGGNVYLMRGEWNEPWIRELCGFPTGKLKDQVDATSTAFNAVLREPAPRRASLTW